MSQNVNYTNKNDSSPFKKGRMQDVVKPTQPRMHKIRRKETRDVENDLYIDLVQVLANNGITLSNVYSLARELVKRGWLKHKKIIRDNE